MVYFWKENQHSWQITMMGLWKVFLNQNSASSENMCLMHLRMVNQQRREILGGSGLLFGNPS